MKSMLLVMFVCYLALVSSTEAEIKSSAKSKDKISSGGKFSKKSNLNFQLASNLNYKMNSKASLFYNPLQALQRNVNAQMESDVDKFFPKDKEFVWEGWLKFLRMKTEQSVIRPTNFFVNNEFFQQKVQPSELKEKDSKNHYRHIIDQFHFFGKLSRHTLNFMSSRDFSITRNVESLHTGLILPIDPELKYQGGVQDLGEFSEGNCIQVFTNEPTSPNPTFNPDTDTKGEKIVWVICTNDRKEKEKLLEYLITIKVEDQRKAKPGWEKRRAEERRSMAHILEQQSNEKMSNVLKTSENPNDGYWALLSDWSQCSKKCDGGSQYQQWMCIPPKNGGAPCKGESVRTRSCNIERCPHQEGLLDIKEQEVKLKPIIQTVPFSTRPQKYDKCVIKEGDVLFENLELIGIDKKETITRVPARLVLNTRTISIFQDDSYKKSGFNLNVKETTLLYDKADACCVQVLSKNKLFRVCGGFGTDCGTKSNPIFANEWIQAFNYFKSKCHDKLNQKNWAHQQALDRLNELNSARADMVKEKEDMINKNLKEVENSKVLSQIRHTQDSAMKALKREFNIEQMLTKEMQLKALKETQELMAMKKNEEKKKECLETAFKNKEEENRKKRENEAKVQKLAKLKEETRNEIASQRSALKKKIEAIMRRSQHKNRQIKREIGLIRTQMAQGLLEAQRLGDLKRCQVALPSQDKIDHYCDEFVNNDLVRNKNCKDPFRFCYICCETEFGIMNLKERDECFNWCDSQDDTKFVWSQRNSSIQVN